MYRAYNYLKNGSISEIGSYDPKKLRIYKQDYLPFYDEFKENADKYTPKVVDNALWAFGKFIKKYPHLVK